MGTLNVIIFMKCQVAIHETLLGFLGVVFLTNGSSRLGMSGAVKPEAQVAMLGMARYPLAFDLCGS